MTEPRRIIIIAGPNGAGKTSFAREFLPQEAHCPDFINADLIAAGLSPFNPEAAALRAGRLMLEEIASRVASGSGFAFETTLSGRAYAQQIPAWRQQGGHSIPEAVIRRRFDTGLRNFHGLYKRLVSA